MGGTAWGNPPSQHPGKWDASVSSHQPRQIVRKPRMQNISYNAAKHHTSAHACRQRPPQLSTPVHPPPPRPAAVLVQGWMNRYLTGSCSRAHRRR